MVASTSKTGVAASSSKAGVASSVMGCLLFQRS
jgi:hypothetical protein